ncbi:hypothetical protein [Nocardioides marmoribigeumensis]|uniref:Capsular polysaccharide biosynthesis protein n=1 Tax=Nocardioides marmoribigeumensis TaxID=433649 RepID=A0ABU2BZH9_9ACTN|nr:hypothetical protein [Nocardioides marmoribigeumensis]MDR7363817.1 capsular polysaccharide biosynthesis protein [Nocardioides marmoribigeumensis]
MDDARGGAPRRTLWVVVGLVGLVALTAGLLMSAQPPAYTSHAVVSLEPKPGRSVPPASTISLLAAPYAAYASADSTLKEVADSAGLTLDEVRSAVAVSLPAGSTNVEVDVTAGTSADAVEIAGRVASKVATFAADDAVLRAAIAIPPTDPKQTLVSRAQPVLAPLGLGLGVALLVLAVFMLSAPAARRRLDRRRSSRPDPVDAEAPGDPLTPEERVAPAGPVAGPRDQGADIR